MLERLVKLLCIEVCVMVRKWKSLCGLRLWRVVGRGRVELRSHYTDAELSTDFCTYPRMQAFERETINCYGFLFGWFLVCLFWCHVACRIFIPQPGPQQWKPKILTTRPPGNSLLLLLSRFSCVRLCATPETAAHQAPPSLGFSRQEHWSGLPFPSPMHESEKWSCSVVSDSSRPHGLQPTRLLRPWDFSCKRTRVGCNCLLQEQ